MDIVNGRRRPLRRNRQKLSSPRLESLEDRHLLAGFMVTTNADSGTGSLRQAILDSNAAQNPSGGTNEIDFHIGSGTQTIAPASPFPTITTPVLLNGETQPGYSGTPLIILDGSSAVGANGTGAGVDGLTISVGDSTVQGLAIDKFGGAGIHLLTKGNNRIENNDIGTDPSGTVGEGNVGDGVLIDNSPGNTIGGTTSDARNIISDNGNNVSLQVPTTNSPSSGLGPADIVAADLTGSGLPDLVTANILTGDLSILSQNAKESGGTISFKPPTIIPISSAPVDMHRVAVGDFNHDGALDLVDAIRVLNTATSSYQSIVTILLNNGDGTFRKLAPISLGSVQVNDLVVGDFGNGQEDIAVAIAATDSTASLTTGGSVDVLLGNGDGTFQPPVTYGTGGAVGIAAGDFNGDGKIDLALAKGFIDPITFLTDGPGDVSLLVNNGDGTFREASSPISVSSGPVNSVAAGDFNGDGKTDLAVTIASTGNSTSPTPNGAVAILLGNGDGTFQPPVDQPVGNNPRRAAVGDFNGDGRLDIVTANRLSNNASVLLGNGDGTFQPAINIPTGIRPFAVTTGDFNGDERTDFAVADRLSNDVTAVLGTTPGNGVHIRGAGSTGNLVLSNNIGTDAKGTTALGNHGDGVLIEGASQNIIGTASAGGANLISGNVGDGVAIVGLTGTGNDATGNAIVGNSIGVDTSTFQPLGNGGNGVDIVNASGTTIGGPALGSANVISSNGVDGVLISGPGASGSTVFDNEIGTTFDGTPLPNSGNGVEIDDAPGNTVGGDNVAPDTRNKYPNDISHNSGRGVYISGSGAVGNRVVGNFVNSNVSGGVAIIGASGNVIGSATSRMQQVISANGSPNPTDNPPSLAVAGVLIAGPGASNNVAQANRIEGNTGDGVAVDGAATNTIGGTATDAGNTISTNTNDGIRIASSPGASTTTNPADANLIQGDTITNNGKDGIAIGFTVTGASLSGADGNTIGGTVAGASNAISGNFGNGVHLTAGANNLIENNTIGINRAVLINPTQSLSNGVGNFQSGVLLENAPDNTIGGSSTASHNVISGNSQDGITISGGGSTGNLILGNVIGTDPTGTMASETVNGISGAGTVIRYANIGDGVRLVGASQNTIGSPGAGNVIANNGGDGVSIEGGSASNRVQGNSLGTDPSGADRLGNFGSGVVIQDSGSNAVGGTTAGAGNLISANGDVGVQIVNPASSSNVVEGNTIGTDVAGANTNANAQGGVLITNGASGNVIGGASAATRNLISGNLVGGVILSNAADNNIICSNNIGLDSSGTRGLGNTYGVLILGSSGNMVGGPGTGNIISANKIAGISIQGNDPNAAMKGNEVLDNLIGLDQSGTVGGDSIGNATDGVTLDNSVANTIGGADASDRNIISGNRGDGVHILGAGSQGNLILGNQIGTDVSGKAGVANSLDGILIENAPGNTIGQAGASNLISANDGNGIQVFGNNSTGNIVVGNLIGTDISGTAPLGNIHDGVLISAAPGNTIGGASPGVGPNVISANLGDGVHVLGPASVGNVVQGNLIGTSAAGTAPLGNNQDGVLLDGVSGTTVGGTVPGARNVISANAVRGVDITGPAAVSNHVLGNFIGTDITGEAPLGNDGDGVTISDAPDNTIGGTDPGARNIISSNGSNGVTIVSSAAGSSTGAPGATGTVVQGNSIGIDAGGHSAIGNAASGISIQNTPSVVIGGSTTGAGNVLSGNLGAGLVISGTSTAVAVQGNFIGTDIAGDAALGNDFGIFLNDAVGNLIGGPATSDRNLISGNKSIGIQVFRVSPPPGSGAPDGNVIAGNDIGTDVTGTSPLGNGSGSTGGGVGIGVFLNNARNTLIATNVISGNLFAGISIFGQGGADNGTGNQVVGNLIGSASDGAPLRGTDPTSFAISARQNIGVLIDSSTGNTIGVAGPEANRIADNIAGVEIIGISSNTPGNPLDNHAVVNQVAGNTIDNNSMGVYLNQATENTIIGDTLTGNASSGVVIFGAQSTNNAIQGNTIVSNKDRSRKPTNGSGVYLESARNNYIEENTISKNGLVGVYLFNQATGNQVQDNQIVKNDQYGVFLYNSAGNVDQIIRKGANSNRLSGNIVANFREFTGAVLPRIGEMTPKPPATGKGRLTRL